MSKNDLKTVQNWSRWCECHNGSPPLMDLTGYVCSKCKKTVCVNCIYRTDKGVLCSDCVKKLKPGNIFSLANKENPKLAHLMKPVAILVGLGFVSFVIVFAMDLPIGDPLYFIPMGFLGLALLIFFGGMILSGLNRKKDDSKLSDESIKDFDKKIKGWK